MELPPAELIKALTTYISSRVTQQPLSVELAHLGEVVTTVQELERLERLTGRRTKRGAPHDIQVELLHAAARYILSRTNREHRQVAIETLANARTAVIQASSPAGTNHHRRA